MRQETLTPYTFYSWTDGIKIVLNTRGVSLNGAQPDAHIVCEGAQIIHDAIDAFKHATFYFIGPELEAKMLMDIYPDRDIRWLKLPPAVSVVQE
jgi:hypothetical protein